MRKLSDFSGAWSLVRDIRHAAGETAHFAGDAVWSPDCADLIYYETGRLEMAGQVMMAERRYRWQPPLTVLFEDGRVFHHVPPQGGMAHHDCPPDTYRIDYDFAAWPVWTVRWHVTGPRKDYTAETRYWR